MRFLILGASGFLGSVLYGLTKGRTNLTVYGTSRYPSKHSTIVQTDVTVNPALKKVIVELNPDIVVWSLMSGENEESLIKLGLTNLLSVIQRETKLIYLSTDAFFIKGKGNYTEDFTPGLLPIDSSPSSYTNAKLRGEHLIKNSDHTNYVILRTGPLYGEDFNKNIEKRTQQVISKIKQKQPVTAASNLMKTFVHVEDLANAILEISSSNFTGCLHVGPMSKESYYSFYKKRLNQLQIDNRFIHPTVIDKKESPYLPLDTSLNTQKAMNLLKTSFRSVDKY